MYKFENRPHLEAGLIEITLGEITLPLEQIDRNRDQPTRWYVIREVINNRKSNEDWENVVRMMEGFYDASIKLRSSWL